MWKKYIRVGKKSCLVSLILSSLIFRRAKFSFVHITNKQQLDSGSCDLSMFISFHSSLFLFSLYFAVVSKRDLTEVWHRTARVDSSRRVGQSLDLNQWSTWAGLHSHAGRDQGPGLDFKSSFQVTVRWRTPLPTARSCSRLIQAALQHRQPKTLERARLHWGP